MRIVNNFLFNFFIYKSAISSNSNRKKDEETLRIMNQENNNFLGKGKYLMNK